MDSCVEWQVVYRATRSHSAEQYMPGNGGGWNANDENGSNLAYWLYRYRPGPATIDATNSNYSGNDPTGNQAHVGGKLYLALDTSGAGVDMICYIQVIKTTIQNVVVDLWLWNRS
jgi:hypothetical protein